MLFLKFIILLLAFFFTLLWFTKLVIDITSLFTGGYSEENAEKDGIVRLITISLISILWTTLIIIW